MSAAHRSNTRRSGALLVAALVFAAWACRSGAGCSERERRENSSAGAAAARAAEAPSELTRPLWAGGAAVEARSFEGQPARDPRDLLAPPDHPLQRLAFSRSRLARLVGDELVVYRLADFEIATRFRVPGARNVVGLVGGGFLIAGREHVFRLSGLEQRPELFARAPRLGPTAILPSTQEAEQFWLFYQGIPKLPRLDLAEPPVAGYLAVLDWLELVDFDRRALLSFGDGSLVYTVPSGLRRIDAEGRREHLPAPQVAGRVWALGRSRRRDQVWALTAHHAHLLTAREAAQTVARIELARYPIAASGHGNELAVLSVESVEAPALRLRVDVYSQRAPPRVLRFTAAPPAGADAGPGAAFEPEIAWSDAGDLLAVSAFGLQIFDWRRERRVFPRASSAQNLAPPPP